MDKQTQTALQFLRNSRKTNSGKRKYEFGLYTGTRHTHQQGHNYGLIQCSEIFRDAPAEV